MSDLCFLHLLLIVSFNFRPFSCYNISTLVFHNHGSMNLLITVPHDGQNVTVGWPDVVTCSSIIYYQCSKERYNDEASLRVTKTAALGFQRTYNTTPHMVVMKAPRFKIDVDSKVELGCKNYSSCIQVYQDFHEAVLSSLRAMKGPVLLLDLHSHKDGTKTVYVSYGGSLNESSLLSLQRRSKSSLTELMCGNFSMIGFLKRQNFKVKESENCSLFLRAKENFIVSHYHTVSNCSVCVDAVRVDIPVELFSTIENRTSQFVLAIADFLKYHNYSSNQSCNQPCEIVSTKAPRMETTYHVDTTFQDKTSSQVDTTSRMETTYQAESTSYMKPSSMELWTNFVTKRRDSSASRSSQEVSSERPSVTDITTLDSSSVSSEDTMTRTEYTTLLLSDNNFPENMSSASDNSSAWFQTAQKIDFSLTIVCLSSGVICFRIFGL